MQKTQAIQPVTTTLAVTTFPDDDFRPLTKYEPQEVARPDYLACISAGYMDSQKGHPVVSRDGTIYLSDPSGRAAGLAAALKATGGQRLTIALPSDRLSDFVHQHYRKEGKVRLEAVGDASGITTIAPNGARTFHASGTKEFAELVQQCKVSTDIAFFLAGWDDSEGAPKPVVYFPDGLAPYRIRTSSEKSVNNLLATINWLRGMFKGSIAGIPIEVQLSYPRVARPTGEKATVPLFSFTFKPPVKLAVSGGALLRDLVAEAAGILPSLAVQALPAPATVDEAIAEFNEDMLTVPLTPERCRARFFGLVKGTDFDNDEARARFLEEYTDGEYTSLAAFTKTATPEAMADMLAALDVKIAGRQVDTDTGEVLVHEDEGQVHDVVAELVQDGEPACPHCGSVEHRSYECEQWAPETFATEDQIDAIAAEMKRCNWSAARCRGFMKKNYGQDMRANLTRTQAEEFIAHLRAQPDWQGTEV